MNLESQLLQRGNFHRYKDPTERGWAKVIDSWEHSHYKTDDPTDYKKHVDIVSFSPLNQFRTMDVKGEKKLFRPDAHSQSRFLIFEHETVSSYYTDPPTHKGWAYGSSEFLIQGVDEDLRKWLIIPMTLVRQHMMRVDWGSINFKPRQVLEEVCYTRYADITRGPAVTRLMADGRYAETRGDRVAHFDIGKLVANPATQVVVDGVRLPWNPLWRP